MSPAHFDQVDAVGKSKKQKVEDADRDTLLHLDVDIDALEQRRGTSQNYDFESESREHSRNNSEAFDIASRAGVGGPPPLDA